MNIQDYKKGDEYLILQLFQEVFGKAMTIEYWNWRFRDNPCGKFMIKLMWDEDKLVGHYAISPVKIVKDNRELLSGLSMTTMTHPDYAGLGVFPLLSQALCKDALVSYGVELIWGFPNNNSHRGFIKNLGWSNINLQPTFSLAVGSLKAKKSSEVKEVESFVDYHAVAYAELAKHYPISVKKDKSYLNWRYVSNPMSKYHIFDVSDGKNGFVVCKEYKPGSGKRQLDIVEWAIGKDESLTKNVLFHLAEIFPDGLFEDFNIWLPLNDERHLYFEKLGFTNKMPVTYFACRTLTSERFDKGDDWWVQLGDSDVY